MVSMPERTMKSSVLRLSLERALRKTAMFKIGVGRTATILRVQEGEIEEEDASDYYS